MSTALLGGSNGATRRTVAMAVRAGQHTNGTLVQARRNWVIDPSLVKGGIPLLSR